MARIKVTENELKRIIRESIQNVINEDGDFTNYYQQLQNKTTYGNDHIEPGAGLTPDQANTRNNVANAALSNWNKLGTVGQIRAIQRLVGIPEKECDGKIGPQTLGKIYVTLRTLQGQQSGLENVDFRPGKAGTYTNINV